MTAMETSLVGCIILYDAERSLKNDQEKRYSEVSVELERWVLTGRHTFYMNHGNNHKNTIDY
jgi:hypothetical protein